MPIRKNYHRGAALLAWRIARYIQKYELDQDGSITTEWTPLLQQAAAAVLLNANYIKAHIDFRDQP